MKSVLQFIRRRSLQKGVALLLCCTTYIMSSCSVYSTRPIPISELNLKKESIEPRHIILHTSTGELGIMMSRLEFPYIYGTLEGVGGTAEINFTNGVSYVLVKTDEQKTIQRQNIKQSEIKSEPNILLNNDLIVQASNGDILTISNISKVDLPWIEGKHIKGKGPVRVNLNNVSGLSIRELNGPKSFLASIGMVAALFGIIFLIVMIIAIATKESCPFVYIDRGYGWELVGEAYAGAAFRSIERDDLLPLPDVGQAERIKLRLKNEARETQYTDRVELVLVEHQANSRALSSFDGRIMIAGNPRQPIKVYNTQGEDITQAVVDVDSLVWQTDIGRIAESGDEQLQDQLTAEFEIPTGEKPILEMVCGNTAWLDLVFGRFFAAMGDRLPEYLNKGNDIAAGPRIQSWREREGVDLRIEMKTKSGWQSLAVVPTVGPIALRRIAVPLPIEENAEKITVRITGGLGFWRFDQLALSSAQNSEPAIHHIQAMNAVSSNGIDQRHVIADTDGQYNALSEMNESLDMSFTLPSTSDVNKRSAFLFTRGYYNVHQPVQSQWSPRILKSIRDHNGGLSRFGRDLAREYLRMYAGSKVKEAHR